MGARLGARLLLLVLLLTLLLPLLLVLLFAPLLALLTPLLRARFQTQDRHRCFLLPPSSSTNFSSPGFHLEKAQSSHILDRCLMNCLVTVIPRCLR